jgi:hypothetical protein
VLITTTAIAMRALGQWGMSDMPHGAIARATMLFAPLLAPLKLEDGEIVPMVRF